MKYTSAIVVAGGVGIAGYLGYRLYQAKTGPEDANATAWSADITPQAMSIAAGQNISHIDLGAGGAVLAGPGEGESLNPFTGLETPTASDSDYGLSLEGADLSYPQAYQPYAAVST